MLIIIGIAMANSEIQILTYYNQEFVTLQPVNIGDR